MGLFSKEQKQRPVVNVNVNMKVPHERLVARMERKKIKLAELEAAGGVLSNPHQARIDELKNAIARDEHYLAALALSGGGE